MKIGDLNKRVIFQYQVKIPDGMGGNISTWEDEATVWAAIWPISASEQVQAMQNVMTISHRIRIRYRTILKPSWRICFGTRYFNIVSIINPDEKNQMLDLICKEASS
jgi:SPP1 family predicted phage head-tail adaptor